MCNKKDDKIWIFQSVAYSHLVHSMYKIKPQTSFSFTKWKKIRVEGTSLRLTVYSVWIRQWPTFTKLSSEPSVTDRRLKAPVCISAKVKFKATNRQSQYTNREYGVLYSAAYNNLLPWLPTLKAKTLIIQVYNICFIVYRQTAHETSRFTVFTWFQVQSCIVATTVIWRSHRNYQESIAVDQNCTICIWSIGMEHDFWWFHVRWIVRIWFWRFFYENLFIHFMTPFE